MRVIAVSGCLRFRFGTEDNGARAKDFAFAVISRIRSFEVQNCVDPRVVKDPLFQ